MTRKVIIVMIMILINATLNAQAPQKMSFQAVIRNASNAVVSRSPIGIRISVLQGSPTGTIVYAEIQNATTNFNGLVSLQIGTGSIVSGTFSLIDWAKGPYFIKTETDPNGGNDYSIVGSSELLSVPYALFALNSSSTTSGTIGEKGNPGLNGTNGTNGIDGAIGARGLSGTNGTNGIDGSIGEPVLTIGQSTQYYRGDKSWQILNTSAVEEGLNNYFTNARARLSLSAGNGLAYNNITGVISSNITQASSTTNGYLTNTDWINFNSKQDAMGFIPYDATNPDAYIQLGSLSSIATGLNYHNNTGIFQLAPTYFIPNSTDLSGVNTGDQTLPTLNSLGAEPIITSGISSQYYRGDKTWNTLNSTVVGLGNLDNTSDINKPVSTATAAYVLANSDAYNSISAGNEIFTTSSSDVLATGLSFSPPAGKYFVNFNSQYSIEPGDRTGQAVIDLTDAYANLMARTVTNSTHGVGYGAGETLSPGVYRTAGAVTTTGTLTLDAGGNPNAEFVFQFGAAMSTGAGFSVILTNGASACNVYWIAEGAIALGASTIMKGMLISNSGAVSLGSMSNVQGNLFSSGGAIGIDASTISKINGCPNSFGSLNNFALFSKTGNISNAGASNITGDIASNSGTVSGFGTATIVGNIYTAGISTATANFSIYQNGILIPYSSRKRTSAMNIGEITLQALATIGEGEILDIRWNIDLGKIKLQNRIFTIQHVR
jgi:hypothetical protein